jgi:uncharacterized protein Veg
MKIGRLTVSTYNYSLYALSDLCIDYFESELVDLKTIDARRNMMTHDYLLVKSYPSDFIEKNWISSNELYRQTISVLRLAKYAILYMVSAVNIAETVKAESGGIPIKYKITSGHAYSDIRKDHK